MPSENITSARSRKLSAILFADIVGYTALMQKDESQAQSVLAKFRNTLNEKVSLFNGQIINDLGDGRLCTFDSAVDAVNCAMQVQFDFIEAPTIPVRIGLHSGDVFFEADNVYGDSVNIASRIESLGIPGSVLFSKRIRQHIDNQPGFEIESLGSFDFKNVNKSMEVYALSNSGLAVPKRSEMKGKMKKKSSLKSYIIAFVVLLLTSATYLVPKLISKDNSSEISSQVLNERIAVLPFKNNTEDRELDILGNMAADWINRGLMEVEDAEVVSPYTVRQHEESIGILPGNQNNKISFYELTGAKNFIDGNFYKEDDEIVFHLSIIDAIDGNLQFSFPEIKGLSHQKTEVITKLRDKIMGYWAAKELVEMKKIKTPNYRAYQLYLDFRKSGANQDILSDILAIDSLFFLPRIHYLNLNRAGLYDDNLYHFDFLERHKTELSGYEVLWLEYLKNLYMGLPMKAYESINSLRLKYPKDFGVNHETAVIAHEGLNNPELALETYNELQLTDYHRNNAGDLYNFRLVHSLQISAELNDTIALRTQFETAKPDKSSIQSYFVRNKIMAASVLNDESSFNICLQELNDVDLGSVFFEANKMFILALMLQSHDINASYHGKVKKIISETLDKSENKQFLETLFVNLLSSLENDEPNLDFDYLNQLPDFMQVANCFWAAPTLYKHGNTEQMNLLIEKLESFTKPNLETSAHLIAGLANYTLGLISMYQENNQKAIEYLKKARDLGMSSGNVYFNYDRNLEPLYNVPEFQEINKPRWPEIKN